MTASESSSDSSPSPSPAVEEGLNGNGVFMPLALEVVSTRLVGGQREVSGNLCSAGGPAAEVTTSDGVRMLVSLSFTEDAGGQDYLCAPSLPMRPPTFGPNVLFIDGYVPITEDRKIQVALENDGIEEVAEIDLNALPACGGDFAVPTSTEWGLILLMAVLLAAGVWTLSRRQSFSHGLPLL